MTTPTPTLFDLPEPDAAARPKPPKPRRKDRPAAVPLSSTPTSVLKPDDRSPADAFAEFDREHPEVYLWFRKYALELLYAGATRAGAKAIVERIRWEVAIQYPGRDLKINNNYTAYYARKLAAEDVRFRDFFQFRLQKDQKAA